MLGIINRQLKQTVFLIDENRSIKKQKLPVTGGALDDERTLKSWFQHRDYLERVQGVKRLALILDIRDAFPKSPYISLTDQDIAKATNIDDLAAQGEQDEIARVERQKSQNRLAEVVDFGIIALMIIVAVFAMLMLAGKVDFGSIMTGLTGG